MRSWEGKGNEQILSIILATQSFSQPDNDFVPKFTLGNLQTKCLPLIALILMKLRAAVRDSLDITTPLSRRETNVKASENPDPLRIKAPLRTPELPQPQLPARKTKTKPKPLQNPLELIRMLHSMFSATVCGKPNSSCFDFSRESCFYGGILELYIPMAEQVLEGRFYCRGRKKPDSEGVIFGGRCRWNVD